MPHSCKLHPQGDGDGKGCDSGAGACAKVRGGREGTGRRGRPGTLIQQPGGESLRASYPEGQLPGTGFREDRRAESTARPKRPESGPRPETLVTGSTIRTAVSSPIATLRQQVGKLRPGKSGAAGSPDLQGLVVPVPRAPSVPLGVAVSRPVCENSGCRVRVLGPPGEGQDPDVRGGGQRKRGPGCGGAAQP